MRIWRERITGTYVFIALYLLNCNIIFQKAKQEAASQTMGQSIDEIALSIFDVLQKPSTPLRTMTNKMFTNALPQVFKDVPLQEATTA